MADVRLNLELFDHNAFEKVQNLSNILRNMESKSYQIKFNIDEASTRRINKIRDTFNDLQNVFSRKFIDYGNFQNLNVALSSVEKQIDSVAQKILLLQAKRDAAGSPKTLEEFMNQEVFFTSRDQRELDRAMATMEVLQRQASVFRSSIEEIKGSQEYKDLEKQLTAEERKQARAEKAEQEAQALRDLSKATQEQAERFKSAAQEGKTFEDVLNGITKIAGGISGVFGALSSSIKTVMSFPGIQQVSGFFDNLLSSPVSGLASTLQGGISGGVERFDIMTSFPRVLEGMGYSADLAASSVERLRDSVLGLPVSLSDTVDMAQYLTLLTGDLEKSTDLTIALNNAFIASGSSSGQMATGLRQVQYLLEGTELQTRQWFSLIRSMPVALRAVGESLGYPDFPSFTADLRQNKIATDDLVDSLIAVAGHGGALDDFLDVFKQKLQSAITNLGIAGERFGETLLRSLNKSLSVDYGGVSGLIKRFSELVDRIGESAGGWIERNADRIIDIIDRFFAIDWDGVMQGALGGLVDTLSTALDFLESGTDLLGSTALGHLFTFQDTLTSVLDLFKNIFSFVSKIAAVLGGIGVGAGIAGISSFVSAQGGILAVLSAMNPVLAGILLVLPGIYALLNTIASGESGAEAIGRAGAIRNQNRDEWASLADQRSRAVSSGSVASYRRAVDLEISTLRNQLNRIDESGIIDAYSGESAFGSGSNFYGIAADIISKERTKVEIKLAALTKSYYGQVLQNYMDLDLGVFEESIGEEYIGLLELIHNAAEKGVASEETINDLLGDFRLKLEEGKEAVEAAKDEVSDAQEVVNTLEQQLSDLDDRISKIKNDIKQSADFKKIWDAGGFLSEQLASDSQSGWLYRNTARDYLGQAQKYKDEIDNIAELFSTLSPEEQELYGNAFFEQLSAIRQDPTQWDKFTTIGKDMREMGVSAFLEGYTGIQLEANEVEAGMQETINSLVKDKLESDLEEAEATLEEKRSNVEELIGDYSQSLTTIMAAVGTYWSSAFDVITSNINVALSVALNSSIIKVNRMVTDYNRMLTSILKNIGNVEVTGSTPRVNLGGNYGGLDPYGRASGGIMPEMGTDIIPAMLTPGEYVHRRAVVQHYGKAFMDRLNNLDLQGALATLSMGYVIPFSTGGLVRSDNRTYRDNHASIVQNFNNSRSDYSFRRANRFVRGLA